MKALERERAASLSQAAGLPSHNLAESAGFLDEPTTPLTCHVRGWAMRLKGDAKPLWDMVGVAELQKGKKMDIPFAGGSEENY
ncbi:uncharacterized protein N7496_007045 [Penicillium cataractarum]|uniref:Uncharacterized protein n=1 Tax=Penicillium cataractarum TaxID=2100454 RepID=A0A9W9S2Q1_9EURO|nr:uncharacterized protein N7496_007045 [Penicillium cataractarum]KAJ5370953.1 hypothetical protein N7496_007045 [Penicillium cataractarum]